MPLNIRDPRAAQLAKELAELRGTTMTTEIVNALENEVRRERQSMPLAKRLTALGGRTVAMAGPKAKRKNLTKIERAALWGDD